MAIIIMAIVVVSISNDDDEEMKYYDVLLDMNLYHIKTERSSISMHIINNQ
jgi:hypothetical protein